MMRPAAPPGRTGLVGLQCGEQSVYAPTDRRLGTPQGGPLSLLLANVLLDEVDKALEARGYCFARYDDDCAPPRRKEGGILVSSHAHKR
jgi:hypothetical protein